MLFTRTSLLTVSVAALLSAGAVAQQAPAPLKLTILHVNDVHSRLLPINRFSTTCSAKEEEEKKCFGGVARIAYQAQEVAKQVKAAGGQTLFLHAGDQFQGSLMYTVYKGKAELTAVNLLDIDAMSLGNHEFDDGPGVLADFLKGTKFPVLSANTDVSKEPRLQGLIRPYTIVERGGQKIGIIGVTTDDTPITSSPGPTVSFAHEDAPIKRYVAELKALGIDKIIALTHSGWVRDQEIAKNVEGIDVIVGGHSHTLLSNKIKEAEGPYPIVVANKVNKTLIVTAEAYSKYLGRLDVTFDAKGNITAYEGEPILLDANVPEDKTIRAEIDKLDAPIQAMKAKPVGTAGVNLDATVCRKSECLMGDLVADALVWATASKGTEFAIQNGGGVRASIGEGPVTLGHVLTVLPFQNTIATLKLKGSDVLAALENGVSKVEENQGRFPQVSSNLRYSWDPKKPAGSRIVSVEVKRNGSFAPLDPNATYALATNDFMRRGGDGYSVFKTNAIDPYDFGPNLEDAVSSFIAQNSPVQPKLEGRVRQP